MLITNDYILPAELTGYVRGALADLNRNQFTLSQFLNDKTIDDLDYRLSRGGQGLADAGVFRSYDTEAPIISRPGVSRISGELPPLSAKLRLDEYSRLRQRKLDTAIRDAVLNDASRLTRGLAARMELARGDALVNGTVTISENGVTATVDFGRNPAHSVIAATPWDQAGADPLADLRTWRDTYVDNTGDEPGVILTSRKVLSNLMQNPAMRNLVFPGTNQPNVVTENAVTQVLQAFGLPGIQLYDARVNVGGSATRVIPDNRVILLPQGQSQLGTTLWGTTAEALDPDFGIDSSEAPGIVAGSYSTKDPVALWTKASAIGLPVLANPDLSFVATVL
jgi:hypothetical protein